MRGAYLEVLADTLGSVGVLLAGAVTLLYGWPYADPLVAIAIGLFVLPRTLDPGPPGGADPRAGRAAPRRRRRPSGPGSPPSTACSTSTTCTSGR